MIFNDWEYVNDKVGGRIIPDRKIAFPSQFSKYYGLSKNSVDALTKGYVYFSHPLVLNDPFDSCRQLIDLSLFSERQFVKLIFNNLKLTNPDSSFTYDEIKNQIAVMYRNNKSGLLNTALTFFWNIVFKDWGILSLSDIDSDLRMWSYYTNHRGFILNFKSDLFDTTEILGPFPINYSDNYDSVTPRSLAIERENLLYVTNIKSNHWKHENEWRFLLNRDNMSIPEYKDKILVDNKRRVAYKSDKLNSIVLGYKFFQENISGTKIGDKKRLFKFNKADNPSDNLRISILENIIENKLITKEIQIAEDNTFNLEVHDITITCIEKGVKYIIESKN